MSIETQKRNVKGQVIGSTPTKAIVDALDAAFSVIRAKYPELKNAVLVVGSQGYSKRGQTHGHFAPDAWEANGKTHEIMLSGESLKRGAEATLGTLLHEATHALAHARGIVDTSREGRYHNKRFKALTEETGIVVDYDSKIGWSPTTLPKATAKEYSKELTALRKALKAYRLPFDKPSRPSKEIRVECDCRAVTLPISFLDKGGILCDLCKELFYPIGSDKGDGWKDENPDAA